MDKIKVSCEIEVTIQMIGGKCKPLILYYLAENGTKRFNELMAYITQISQKTLTNQLRELEGRWHQQADPARLGRRAHRHGWQGQRRRRRYRWGA